MQTMKGLPWVAVAAILGLTACNYTEGPCYRREDIEGSGPNGVGGGPIVPGWGGYGDVPPDPQDNTDPKPVDCNLEEQPDKGDDSGGSCGDSSTPTITEGETLTYCTGACQNKCPTGGVNGFSASVFKFTTLVPDDGKDEGGGWQVATAKLEFFRWISVLWEDWNCMVTVGMPIRTAVNGTISPSKAATITAGIASEASFDLMHVKPPLPSGIFCSKLGPLMQAKFKAQYPTVGATVK